MSSNTVGIRVNSCYAVFRDSSVSGITCISSAFILSQTHWWFATSGNTPEQTKQRYQTNTIHHQEQPHPTGNHKGAIL